MYVTSNLLGSSEKQVPSLISSLILRYKKKSSILIECCYSCYRGKWLRGTSCTMLRTPGSICPVNTLPPSIIFFFFSIMTTGPEHWEMRLNQSNTQNHDYVWSLCYGERCSIHTASYRENSDNADVGLPWKWSVFPHSSYILLFILDQWQYYIKKKPKQIPTFSFVSWSMAETWCYIKIELLKAMGSLLQKTENVQSK